MLPKGQRGQGRPAFAITQSVLKKVEKLGAAGLNQRWAAMALGIGQDTFHVRLQDNSEFSDAWKRGKAKLAMEIAEAAPKVIRGLIKNAITPTEASPGGNVAAQLGFHGKVLRDANEEAQANINLEELGGGIGPQESGPIEIQEVRVRRITRSPAKGRIEDGFE